MIHPRQGAISSVLNSFRWLPAGPVTQKIVASAMEAIGISAVCDATNNPPSVVDAGETKVFIDGEHPTEITISEDAVMLRSLKASGYVSVAMDVASHRFEVSDGGTAVSRSGGPFDILSQSITRGVQEEVVSRLQVYLDELMVSVFKAASCMVICDETNNPPESVKQGILNLDVTFNYVSFSSPKPD